MDLFGRDTSPEARAVLIRLLREMPPKRKLRQACALTDLVRELARSGLRTRHPNAPPEELRWRFAALTLGAELARKVYGPGPSEEGCPWTRKPSASSEL